MFYFEFYLPFSPPVYAVIVLDSYDIYLLVSLSQLPPILLLITFYLFPNLNQFSYRKRGDL